MIKKTTPVEELTYEQAFTELESLIASLEANQGSLDEVLGEFERGQELAKHCAVLLDQAELKVKQLSEETITDFELKE